MKSTKLFLIVCCLFNLSHSFANEVHLKCKITENIEVDTKLADKFSKLGNDLKEEQRSDQFGEILASQFVKGALEIDYLTRIKSFSIYSGSTRNVEVTGTFEDSDNSKYEIETSELDENGDLTVTITFPSESYYKPSSVKSVVLSANNNSLKISNTFVSENNQGGYLSLSSLGIEEVTYKQEVRCER